MKHVLLKSALISFAMMAAATAWARDSTPDTARQTTATDRVMVDRAGNPRSLRAQWVYRIVAKWGAHVQEAYRTDPRRWADSMAQVFAKASPDALQRAAEARTFAAMNDVLLAGTNPAAMQPVAEPNMNDASSKRIAARSLGDPGQDLVYVPVTPCRILDTRIVGGPIPANSVRSFDLTDVAKFVFQGGDATDCGVGGVGSFAAAAINFTVVFPNAAGYITAFPYQTGQPAAATLNYDGGDIRNGLAIIRLDQGVSAEEFSVYSFAQTQLVADVVGYFIAPQPTELECVSVQNILANQANQSELNSPSCPVTYVMVSGECFATNRGSATISSSIDVTTSRRVGSVHNCQFSRRSGVSTTVRFDAYSSANCCRIPGR